MTISTKALVIGLIIGFVIGGAFSWFVKPREIERVTETETLRITETVTVIPTPKGSRYLSYDPSRGGNETKILLLKSSLSYGVFEVDWSEIRKGDPCVIVTLTIRNDYTEEWPSGYWVSFSVKLYNTDGKEVGYIFMPYKPQPSVAEVCFGPGATDTIDIYLAYDKQDIERYEVYIWSIKKMPTP